MSVRFVGARVAVAAMLAANVAAAAPPEDKTVADALFQHGRALLGAGNVKEACPKLAESQRIDPQIGTLLYLATCHEQEGRLATAHAELNEALALLARAPQKERERYARERLAAITPLLSYVAITIETKPAGVEVKLDGQPLGEATFGTPLPLDPGAHEVTATAPNKRAFRQSFEITRAPRKLSVNVTLADEPVAKIATAPSETAPPITREAQTPSTRTITGWTAVGIGVAGIAVGAIFGARTMNAKAEAEDGPCAGRYCTTQGLALYDEARGYATVSTLAFGIGAVALAAGVYLVRF